jgi:hypothetical protein
MTAGKNVKKRGDPHSGVSQIENNRLIPTATTAITYRKTGFNGRRVTLPACENYLPVPISLSLYQSNWFSIWKSKGHRY